MVDDSISRSTIDGRFYSHGADYWRVPFGTRLHNYGKSPFSMGKSTISMAIFNSFFVCLPEGISTALLESTKKSIGISRKNGGTNGLVEWVNGSRMFLD